VKRKSRNLQTVKSTRKIDKFSTGLSLLSFSTSFLLKFFIQRFPLISAGSVRFNAQFNEFRRSTERIFLRGSFPYQESLHGSTRITRMTSRFPNSFQSEIYGKFSKTTTITWRVWPILQIIIKLTIIFFSKIFIFIFLFMERSNFCKF